MTHFTFRLGHAKLPLGPRTGMSKMATSLIGRQAVVVGAGMAGLPAARALADYFEQVTVLERDALPADASPRIGTPQSRHTRALLGGGQRTLSELFPGFEQDLRGAGAVPYRAGLDVRFERPGFDPFPQRDLGWIGYAMSRPLIERTVRRHVGRHQKHHDTCTLPRPGTRALAQRHRGVGNPFREQRRTRSETLPADLAGEASGRGSLALASLGSIGQPPPEETVIEVDITYATAAFAIPEDAAADWRGVMTLDWPAQGGLGGIVKPLERNRWSVTLVGRHGDIPPTDREGFLAYAGRLRTPTIYDAIKNAEQLGEIARFGFPASVRRHFDRLKKFPRGLLTRCAASIPYTARA